MKRSKKTIDYHGRKGKPVVHTTKAGFKGNGSRKYIMVRKKNGGVKRLYQGSKYQTGENKIVRLKI